MATATATRTSKPRKRKPPTPKALQARKLTVPDAVEQYVTTSKAIAGLEMLQADAKKFLLENSEKTGRRTFEDRIAVIGTGGQRVFDQAKAKERLLEIGDDLDDYSKRAKRGQTLQLLK